MCIRDSSSTNAAILISVAVRLSQPLRARRTVATHVSHILKKLDVNSRIDIARESALRNATPR